MENEKIKQAFYQLQPFLESMTENLGIPGYCISAVGQEGTIITISGGEKQKGFGEKPNGDTIFMIGSCSKSVTSLAALILVEEGLLDLDTPVLNYIPVSLYVDGEPVTVRHLLNHSSGLPNLGMSEVTMKKVLGEDLPGLLEENNPFTTSESFFSYVNEASKSSAIVPGEKFIYSNSGFTLAAEVISAVSGISFEEFVNQRIFSPLNMTRSGYTAKWFEGKDNVSYGTRPDGGVQPLYFESIIAGCGGVISTVNDLSRYIQGLLNAGNSIGPVTLPMIEELEKPYVSHNMGSSSIGKGLGAEYYGLGWMVFEEYLNTKVLAHGGSTGIESAGLFYSRQLQFGMTGVCNEGRGEGLLELFFFMVTAICLDKDPFSVFPIFQLEQQYKALCGIYTTYKDIVKAEISYKNGLLWWRSIDGNKNSIKGEFPMIPDQNSNSNIVFKIYSSPGAYSKVLFFKDSDDCWRLHRERNVMRKKST